MQQLKIFGCLLAILVIITPLHGLSISNFGDVEIYINETDWKCDKISCPRKTYKCRVTKQKLKPDAEEVERVNTCYSKEDKVLAEDINYDPIGATESISLDVLSYRNGSIVSSGYDKTSSNGRQFEQKKFKIVSANVGKNLGNANKQVKLQMKKVQFL